MCVNLSVDNILFGPLFKSSLLMSGSGNGVVIHLPGLFEEAEKNLQKGNGETEEVQ